MKHLENYGVQELNARETINIDGGCKCPGGFFQKLGRVVGYTAGMLVYGITEGIKIIIE